MALQKLQQQPGVGNILNPDQSWGYYSQNLDSTGDTSAQVFNSVKNPISVGGVNYDPAGFGGMPPPGSNPEAFKNYFNNLDMWNTPNQWALGGGQYQPDKTVLGETTLQGLYSPEERAMINPLSQGAIDRTVARYGSGGGDSFFGGMFDSFVHDVIPTAVQFASAAAGAYGFAAGGGGLLDMFSGGSGMAGGGGGMAGNIAGYQPAVADAIWSENAIPGLGTAMQTGSNLSNLYSAGSKLAGVAGGGSTQKMPSQTGQTTGWGTNMAGIGDLTLQNLSGLISGGADYLTTLSQQNKMGAAYKQASDLMTSHSPEQQAIRAQTMNMIQKPGDFFQDPLYQAAFGQGQQALERSQASKGMAGSGGAAAELQKYGQTFGADMYNQRLVQLSGLSGISQDQTQRNLTGANLIQGAEMKAGLQGSGIAGLAGGIGAAGHTSATGLGGVTLSQMMSGLGSTGNYLQSLFSGNSNLTGSSQSNQLADQTSGFSSTDLAGWGGTDPNAIDPNSWNSLMNYSGDGAALDTSVNTWGY